MNEEGILNIDCGIKKLFVYYVGSRNYGVPCECEDGKQDIRRWNGKNYLKKLEEHIVS